MVNPEVNQFVHSPDRVEIQPEFQIEPAVDSDYQELYAALVDSFGENLETSIPEFKVWSQSKNNPNLRTWIIKENQRVQAFLTLGLDPKLAKSEIRTIGVVSKMRGKGYAKALIQTALNFVHDSGIPACELTVAAANLDALNLYRKFGFQVIEKYDCYQWRKV